MNPQVTIHQNEVLAGRINVKPNENNPRDLDIDFSFQCDGKLSKINTQQSYKMR